MSQLSEGINEKRLPPFASSNLPFDLFLSILFLSDLFGPRKDQSIRDRVHITDNGEVILNDEEPKSGMLCSTFFAISKNAADLKSANQFSVVYLDSI